MKLLGTVNVLGVPLKVIRTSVDEVADPDLLTDNEQATFEPDTNTIRLNETCAGNPEFEAFNLVHEMGHAWLGLSGVRQYLRDRLGVSDAEWEKIEEVIVRMYAPAVNSSLKSLATVIARLSK